MMEVAATILRIEGEVKFNDFPDRLMSKERPAFTFQTTGFTLSARLKNTVHMQNISAPALVQKKIIQLFLAMHVDH